MPFRAARRPPDLERVARILGAGTEEPDDLTRLDADLRRARRPGLLTLPDELRTARRGISSAAVVSLLALAVAVGCVFVLRVLWAERSATPSDVAPVSSRTVAVVGGAAAPSGTVRRDGPTAALTPSASAGGSETVVHVVGQVVRPGLVRLRAGARVADAITGAGGARPGADVSALNLARPVVDGEQIRVPRPGEVLSPPGIASGGAGAPGGAGGTGGTGGAAGAPVSLNTADLSALDALPGVGPVLAQRIVDWRAEHGRFTAVDELGEVSGIGDTLMERLRPRVTL